MSKTEQTFDLEAVLERSEAIQSDFAYFDSRMAQLEQYEGAIFVQNSALSTTIPFHEKGQFGLKVSGSPLSFTRKSLNDFFQKADSDVKIQHFHAVKDLIGQDGNPVGLDLLHAVRKHTKRDGLKEASKEHMFKSWDGNLLGIMAPSSQHRFSFYKLLSSVRDTIALNSKSVMRTELSFNPQSASAKARIFFDSLLGEKDKGWGLSLQTGYAGNSAIKGRIAQINWLCSNGQLSAQSKSAFSLKNSSQGNIMQGCYSYINKFNDYWSLPDEHTVVLDFIEAKDYDRIFDDYEVESAFYELMGKTFVTAVNMEKSKYERAMVRARETTMDDIVGEYKKLRAKYSSILTQSDIDRLLLITDQDPTIEQEQYTQYSMVQAVTRYANDPNHSEQRSERLQALGDEILLTVTA